MPKLFNFSCYAVLSVDNCDDPETDPFSPELRGFWPDEASARAAAGAIEAARIEAHKAHYRRGDWIEHLYRGNPPAPSITRYAIVSLVDVEAPSLDHLETSLEEAARLQIQGIGKLPSASVVAEEADDVPSGITDPRDGGECDPLYGQRMDSADVNQERAEEAALETAVAE